ncbi:hypothetical protein PR048_001753 [Dryococelus australis]|uniref:DUF4371 domain-containing protein n=1 Tax=Dryococelus australis TaxID=614101 RepID=A0ABQ9IJL4_9NEOP|nr:hypothetical protein PR048_001753 [Dryococelus australis]
MYSSPTVQYELLSLIGKHIQETVVERIRMLSFSLYWEMKLQISTVYVDIDIVDIREDFLTLVPMYDVTGAGIASTIKKELQKLGLDTTNLRGQGYDGAGAMSGHLNGVQAITRKLFTLIVRPMSLTCVSYAAKSDVIRNCFFTISEVATFSRGSAERIKILKDGLEAAGIPNCAVHNYNDTRCVERHDCVAVFSVFSLYCPSLGTVDRMKASKNKSIGLHSNLCSFESIVTHLVISKMLSITYHLSQFLQRDNLDFFFSHDQN